MKFAVYLGVAILLTASFAVQNAISQTVAPGDQLFEVPTKVVQVHLIFDDANFAGLNPKGPSGFGPGHSTFGCEKTIKSICQIK